MNEIEMVIPVPEWLADTLACAASLCEKSIDEVAVALFANEVVHTSRGDRDFI